MTAHPRAQWLEVCTAHLAQSGSTCVTFTCATETSVRVWVQAQWSCCIAPWNQLRVRGARMAAFYVFSVLAGCCWVWCGLQRGEARRTNTFLIKIPLWSEHFKHIAQVLCHWQRGRLAEEPVTCVSALSGWTTTTSLCLVLHTCSTSSPIATFNSSF